MHILVTGARGFVGSHLGNELVRKGHTVVGVDNLSNVSLNIVTFPVHEHNVKEITKEELEGVDVIYHLAARVNVDESIEKPQLYFTENVDDTIHLLELVRHHFPKVKFVYASTSEVYGSGKMHKMNEEHPLEAASPYAVSKLAADKLVTIYGLMHNLDTTVVRNFNTFGEYQRDGLYGGVIPKFVTQALHKQPITIFGDGTQSRDYMHVSQAITGYTILLEKVMPRLYNCGLGETFPIIDIARRIAQKFDVPIEHLPSRPNEVQFLCADVSLAAAYEYHVTTDFWKMLDQYIAWRTAQHTLPS
jgi:nucleoside-diphosphate-sugar epimerase